ncbi:uncharacterized protein DFL_009325 [Arthrobotrys flagrans]|uniref:Cytochrome P450 n=1 Tax=Arthrobotrys flagrans TaxID=97331 RepID=A0A436ZRC5_ARTFL|nr:hypothetical protein DFL_009325 [Arthrobotrys flagrans]
MCSQNQVGVGRKGNNGYSSLVSTCGDGYYWEVCYGKDFGLVQDGGLNDFVQSLFGAVIIFSARGQIPALKFIEYLLSYIPHPKVQWFLGCNNRITGYGDMCLNELRKGLENSKDGNSRPTLFSKLLSNTENPDAKYRMGPTTLRDEAGIMPLVGSQTTALVGTILYGLYPDTPPRAKNNLGHTFSQKDCSRFKPERWLNATKEMESAMLASGGASRLCIGKNLAMMELRILAAKMLKECGKITLADSCTDESMELEEIAALLPKSRKCELQQKARE